MVACIPRFTKDPKTEFIQCGRHAKSGAILWISLPDLTPCITVYYILVPHFIKDKIVEIGTEDLNPIILTEDTITETSQ